MTEKTVKKEGLDDVLYALPERIAKTVSKLPFCVKCGVYEIRLRANRPVCLTMDRNFYISQDGVVSTLMPRNPLIITREELSEVVVRLTDRSVYTRSEELCSGYISMKNGNRAGICGSFNQGVFGEVSSINIRIARSVMGAATSLYEETKGGLLIAGGPGSGKTTILRDLIRHLSNNGRRVCVVDSRGEIAACERGHPKLDIGVNTDVISGVNKEKGLEIAVRTMFPQIVAFDEIANEEELKRLFEGFFSGITVIATAHIGSKEELVLRSVTAKLIENRVVAKVALLPSKIGGEIEVVSVKDMMVYA